MPIPPSSTDRVLGIDDEETALVVDAIGTDTARQILAALDDGPRTVAELADETGHTNQNVSYHLGKLTEAGLACESGSRTTGGNAATVYATGETTLLSTDPDVEHGRPRLGTLGLVAGVVLTLLCLHSIPEPTIALVTTVVAELGHLLPHL